MARSSLSLRCFAIVGGYVILDVDQAPAKKLLHDDINMVQ